MMDEFMRARLPAGADGQVQRAAQRLAVTQSAKARAAASKASPGCQDVSFPKGVSGNPNGRPRIVADLQTAARALAPEALSVLAEIMANKRHPAAARVAAANAILDRGFGRPSTAVIVQAPTPTPEEEQRQRELAQSIMKRVEDMTRRSHEMERRAIAAERQLAAHLPESATREEEEQAL
jgi:hypothetical protein